MSSWVFLNISIAHYKNNTSHLVAAVILSLQTSSPDSVAIPTLMV